MKKRVYKITTEGTFFTANVSTYLKEKGIFDSSESEQPFDLSNRVFFTKPITRPKALMMAFKLGLMEVDRIFGGKSTIEEEVL